MSLKEAIRSGLDYKKKKHGSSSGKSYQRVGGGGGVLIFTPGIGFLRCCDQLGSSPTVKKLPTE